MRIAVLLAAVLAAAVALPGAAGAQTPNQQSVTGSFDLIFADGSFNAVSDPSGANTRGQVDMFVGAGVRVTGTAVCLSVTGNRAVIGFVGTLSNLSTPPDRAIGEIVAVDNGPATAKLDTVTVYYDQTATGTPNCSALGTRRFGPSVADVTVHAAAMPTSKQQCKKGGWRSFGVFTNQGDCVSFVATKGKNAPAGSQKKNGPKNTKAR
jgi:hypothetical protein